MNRSSFSPLAKPPANSDEWTVDKGHPAEAALGRVASLHLHPLQAGQPFTMVDSIEVVAGKGIAGNPRYFGRPTRRQVTLISREQIAGHAVTLGVDAFEPGAVRSNIETEGIDLMALLNCEVQVGEATLLFYEPRTPCHKMEALCKGLRGLMEHGRQGVLAQVVIPGRIRMGDAIRLAKRMEKS